MCVTRLTSHSKLPHISLMQISQLDFQHILPVVSFSPGGAPATTGIAAVLRNQALVKGSVKWPEVQGVENYFGCAHYGGLESVGLFPTADTQCHEDAQGLTACGERWRREGCNMTQASLETWESTWRWVEQKRRLTKTATAGSFREHL